jgi:6,7-dimethyl-8-ribityllumazine synthase
VSTLSASFSTTDVDATRFRFAIIVSKFNRSVTSKLEEGAKSCFDRHKVPRGRVSVFYCPGAFELPQVANRLLKSERYDAVVCLGAIIRGETAHFDYVAANTASGILKTALAHATPVAFGVLTTNSEAQALERAGGIHGNKGWEAAIAAMEMAGLFRGLSGRKHRMAKGKKGKKG